MNDNEKYFNESINILKGLWHGQNYAYSFKHELQT